VRALSDIGRAARPRGLFGYRIGSTTARSCHLVEENVHLGHGTVDLLRDDLRHAGARREEIIVATMRYELCRRNLCCCRVRSPRGGSDNPRGPEVTRRGPIRAG